MKLNGLFQEIALTMCNGGSCNKNLYYIVSSQQYCKGIYLLSNEYMIQIFLKCPEATSGKWNNKFSCRDLCCPFREVWGCGFGWDWYLNTMSWKQWELSPLVALLQGAQRARAVLWYCVCAELLLLCSQLIRDLTLNSGLSAWSQCSNSILNHW